MSSVRVVRPRSRLSGIVSGRDRDGTHYRDRVTGIVRYRCPNCGTVTGLSVRTNLPRPELPSEIVRLFDSVEVPSDGAYISHLDFRCRLCGTPARLVIRARPVQKYFEYDVAAVIELKAPE